MFNRIVAVNRTGLEEWAIKKLAQFGRSVIVHQDDPIQEALVYERVREADAILVSWRTAITADIIDAAPELKYIGICASLYDPASSNVDVVYARSKGIVVKGVRDYGDEGVVEFIMSQLVFLAQGLGKQQWQSEPTELAGKRLGIIGFGAVGQMLAKRAQAFGMRVAYFNRSRKMDAEQAGVKYLPLHDLLAESDIISTHLPKHSVILGKKEIALLRPTTILVNTSLGVTFDVDAFLEWIDRAGNYAIFDSDGSGAHIDLFNKYPNILVSTKSSGFTLEARKRLSEKVVKNIETFFLAER